MKYIISLFVVLVVFALLLFMFIIPSCEKNKTDKNITGSGENVVNVEDSELNNEKSLENK